MTADPLAGLWPRILEALQAKNAPEVARKLQLTKQSVYEWERGKRPGLDTLVAIAKTGNVSLDWLVLGNLPKRRSSVGAKENTANDTVTTEVQNEIRRQVIDVLRELLSAKDRAFADSLLADLERSLKLQRD